MIQFKEISGQPCKMLEKPVPLTPDAQFPCVVRLIQDDTPMGRSNAFHLSPLLANNDPIIIDAVKDYSVSVVFNNMIFYYANFEILGYPVAEGSAEWALYQMQQGRFVHQPCDFNCIWKFNVGMIIHCNKSGKQGFTYIVDEFLKYAPRNGWQIYEPKKELCPACNGTGVVMHETPNDATQPQFQVVKITLEGTVRSSINDCCFELSTPNNGWATIGYNEIDPATRSLVESLLKAQDENNG